MADGTFTLGAILQIVFKYINESPSTLAEFYIDRDRTLVYKWMHGTASPSKKLIPEIVRFIVENAGEPARLRIQSDLDKIVQDSDIPFELKGVINSSTSFETYLTDVINIAITERKSSKAATDLPDYSIDTELADNTMKPVKALSTAIPTITIAFAILSAITGGLLWNLTNHLFSWPHYMGGSGNEPLGFAAFIWGVVSISPIVVFVIFSLPKDAPAMLLLHGFKKVGLIFVYAFACGIGGLLFYSTGFRGYIEQLNMSYVLQETIIVFAYSLILSFLPIMAVLLLLRLPKMKPFTFLFLEFFSAAMCILAVISTALVNRPEAEIAQLRGFLVSLALKLTMFISIRVVIKGYPNNISITLRKRS